MLGRGRTVSALVVGGSLALAAGVGAAVPAAATTAVPSTTPKVVTINVHKTTVGKRVSAKGGRTVYMFSIDTSKKSNCKKKCLASWKPVTSEKAPKAGPGISKKHLARIAHDQVKYHGHPLYYFVGDTAAKQANGEGLLAFGGYWYTLTAKGKRG